MEIEQIIFNILNGNAHNWVRYWRTMKTSGLDLPGEYIELRSSFITDQCLENMLENGFKIQKIQSIKINADSYCDVLLKRSIS